MNPHLVPPPLANEILKEHEAVIVNDVVVPVVPDAGDGEQPTIVYVPDGAPPSLTVTVTG